MKILFVIVSVILFAGLLYGFSRLMGWLLRKSAEERATEPAGTGFRHWPHYTNALTLLGVGVFLIVAFHEDLL